MVCIRWGVRECKIISIAVVGTTHAHTHHTHTPSIQYPVVVIFCLDRLVKYVTKDFNLVFAVSWKRRTYPSRDMLMRIGAANDWMMVLWRVCVRAMVTGGAYLYIHFRIVVIENVFNVHVCAIAIAQRLVFMFIFIYAYLSLVFFLSLLMCCYCCCCCCCWPSLVWSIIPKNWNM